MRRPDGSWKAPPPPWPAPGASAAGSLSGEPSVLMEWTDMGRRSPGKVYDRAGMAAFAVDACR
jgi:hypothetical protein